jgi:hypothetical protein
MRFLAASFLIVTISAAQVPERFEVASLKPSRPGTRFSSTTDQAQLNCSAHTLMALIRTAYPDIAVESWRVSGGAARPGSPKTPGIWQPGCHLACPATRNAYIVGLK